MIRGKLIGLLLFGSSAIAQPPQLEWSHTYCDGIGGEARDIIEVSDGGYAAVGFSGTYNAYDVWIARLDSIGDTLWTVTVDDGYRDYARSILEMEDGGFLVSGSVYRGGTDGDLFLMRLSSEGEVLWMNYFGGQNWENGGYLIPAHGEGYVLFGSSWSFGGSSGQVYLVMVGEDGQIAWQQSFGGFYNESVFAGAQTADGGFIFTGQIQLGGSDYDVYLIKTNFWGDTLWTKRFGGALSDLGNAIHVLSDGGFLISGIYQNPDVDFDWYVIRTDSLGNPIWERTYGAHQHDKSSGSLLTEDEGLILTGFVSWAYGAEFTELLLLRINSNGDIVWTRSFDNGQNDRGFNLIYASDGGMVVAGYTGDESFGDVTPYSD